VGGGAFLCVAASAPAPAMAIARMMRTIVLVRIAMIPRRRRFLQQPLADVDIPVVDDVPVGHGILLVPVGTTVLCTGLGNGLRPPVVSSVDPMGTPTRPVPDRTPLPGEEADAEGLDDAVVPPAQVLEVAPDMPVLSKRKVGADVPPILLLVPAIEVP